MITNPYSRILKESLPFVKIVDKNHVIAKANDIDPSSIIFYQGILSVPRCFGSKGELHTLIRERLNEAVSSLYTLSLAYRLTYNEEYRDKFNKIFCDFTNGIRGCKDGGQFFWDFFIGRMEGDTPIVLATVLPKLAIACDICQTRQVELDLWADDLLEYVNDYNPSQRNNHLAWKSLCLLMFGRNRESTYKMFENCLGEITSCGDMPLELSRGDRGLSYTLMALESLWLMCIIFSDIGLIFDKEPLVRATNRFFHYCENGYKKAWRPDDVRCWYWIALYARMANVEIESVKIAYSDVLDRAWTLMYPQIIFASYLV